MKIEKVMNVADLEGSDMETELKKAIEQIKVIEKANEDAIRIVKDMLPNTESYDQSKIREVLQKSYNEVGEYCSSVEIGRLGFCLLHFSQMVNIFFYETRELLKDAKANATLEELEEEDYHFIKGLDHDRVVLAMANFIAERTSDLYKQEYSLDEVKEVRDALREKTNQTEH